MPSEEKYAPKPVRKGLVGDEITKLNITRENLGAKRGQKIEIVRRHGDCVHLQIDMVQNGPKQCSGGGKSNSGLTNDLTCLKM